MYTYKTKGGKELTMNDKAREGFKKFMLKNNDLFVECAKAYKEGNIDRLAALTSSLYGRMFFLKCVFDEYDKTLLELEIANELLYTIMLLYNPETEKVTEYVKALNSKK